MSAPSSNEPVVIVCSVCGQYIDVDIVEFRHADTISFQPYVNDRSHSVSAVFAEHSDRPVHVYVTDCRNGMRTEPA